MEGFKASTTMQSSSQTSKPLVMARSIAVASSAATMGVAA